MLVVLVVVLCVTAPSLTPVDANDKGKRGFRRHTEERPYGDYCPRQQSRYGSTRAVESEEAARKILESYYHGEDVHVGPIEQKRGFYRAEIIDSTGSVVDIVIIDSRTGRIRSTF